MHKTLSIATLFCTCGLVVASQPALAGVIAAMSSFSAHLEIKSRVAFPGLLGDLSAVLALILLLGVDVRLTRNSAASLGRP
jgi:hypothetical protein